MNDKLITGNISFPKPICRNLSNGLEVISVKDNSHPVLCLQLYIRTGSTLENDQQRGYSHFIEHLSFKSTSDFPNNKISLYASGLGGMLNAFTDYDCTCYYLNLPSEKLKEGFHILSQLAFHSTFSKEDVSKEKEIILEEIKQYQNDPESDFLEYIQTNCYQKSPLRYPVLGNPKSINSARYKELREFYKNRYTPVNSFLVICGNYQENELDAYLDTYFSAWENISKPLPYLLDIEPEMNGFRYIFRKKAIGDDTIAFAFPELSEKHPLANALLIAMRYFAIGRSSRLYNRLVEKDKLCSSVKVNSLCGVLSGVSVIYITPISATFIPDIIRIVYEEYSALLQFGIPLAELELIKKDIINSWLFSFEGMENLANLIAAEKFTGDLCRLQKYGDEINSISIEAVMAAIHKYWLPEGITVYHEGSCEISGTKKQAKQIKESLAPKKTILCAEEIHNISIQNLNPPPLYNAENTRRGYITQIDDNYYQIVLSNNVKVIFKQQKNNNISGFSLSTPISQISETPSEIGHNFFCTSLQLYKTQKHSHQELLQYSRNNGFNIRLIHHLDTTTFRGKCLGSNLDKALAMLAESIFLPSFDHNYFSVLTSTALDGICRDNDYPVSYAYMNWYKMLVGNKSNLFRPTGSATQIRSIRIKHLQQWYEDWNIGKDFCLAIVGNHNPQEILELCEKNFGLVHNVSHSPKFKPFYSPSSVHFKKTYRNTDQAIIYIGGFASPAIDRDENTAFYILSQILGGDISSRFFDILREKYAYAYQTGFDFHSLNELGFWNAYAFCDKDDYNNCLALMKEIIYSIADKGVKENELETAKQYLIGMNRFEDESVSYTASTISNLVALGYEPEYYLLREERIKKVNSELIWQIAKKWLLPDNQYIYIML